MKRFTQLFLELDRTTRTSEKLGALERYFSEAHPRDAAWALALLAGQRLTRVVKTATVASAAIAESGIPGWLLDECTEAVGDFSETIAHLLPLAHSASDDPLHTIIEEWIQPLARTTDTNAIAALRQAWERLDTDQRFIFNKLIRGNFRVGVNKRLVVRALATIANVDPSIMAHRLSGKISPTEAVFARLISTDTTGNDGARPYPFCLANQLSGEPDTQPNTQIGPINEWSIEHKWDGIRAQIIHRGAVAKSIVIWSRGDELITDQFPEIAAAAQALPRGTVLDGEILAWRFAPSSTHAGSPLSFNDLQKRLNRKNVQPTLFDTESVVFLAFDLLERDGIDIRSAVFSERRVALESLFANVGNREHAHISLSPILHARTWADAAEFRANARAAANAEGLMLKNRASPYAVARAVGGWWKWKVDPYAVDAVLIYAQAGSGKRAGLYTDYTFGVWNGPPHEPSSALVPFAKAYSGLTDEEIAKVDAFIRRNITGRLGPVRTVKPELVFEIAFEGLRESPRHRSGIAVRFPRIARQRPDKQPAEADTLAFVRTLLQ